MAAEAGTSAPAPTFENMEDYVTRLGGKRPFRKVLIANNGIAAVKAIRSVRRWAYETFGDARLVRGRGDGNAVCVCLVPCARVAARVVWEPGAVRWRWGCCGAPVGVARIWCGRGMAECGHPAPPKRSGVPRWCLLLCWLAALALCVSCGAVLCSHHAAAVSLAAPLNGRARITDPVRGHDHPRGPASQRGVHPHGRRVPRGVGRQ